MRVDIIFNVTLKRLVKWLYDFNLLSHNHAIAMHWYFEVLNATTIPRHCQYDVSSTRLLFAVIHVLKMESVQ